MTCIPSDQSYSNCVEIICALNLDKTRADFSKLTLKQGTSHIGNNL